MGAPATRLMESKLLDDDGAPAKIKDIRRVLAGPAKTSWKRTEWEAAWGKKFDWKKVEGRRDSLATPIGARDVLLRMHSLNLQDARSSCSRFNPLKAAPCSHACFHSPALVTHSPHPLGVHPPIPNNPFQPTHLFPPTPPYCPPQDILHCHDWSSAPVAWLHAESYKQYGLGNARTVFTIHNLEFGQALIGRAMAACNMATTVSASPSTAAVSPTYTWEIGGYGAVAAHRGKFHGILNGIDPDIWDPMTDRFLPMRYSSEEVVEGKRAAKDELRRRLNLRFDDRPVVGIVTQLTAQKGIHLIKHTIWRTLDRGGRYKS
ncbi:unnamed protein product [Closterium sp. Naga37s-1]|nr:unnamed protein product [Closterium sp. Naga37s-1]